MYEPNIDYYQGEDKDQIKKLLENVELYKLYNKLEQESKIIPEEESCNEGCSDILKEKSIEISNLLNLCKGICNIILNVINNNGFCSVSSCFVSFIYLNIWLYERVSQITKSDSEINDFYKALKSIKQTKELELKKCSIINFNEKKQGFMNMKYLYEFLHIYEDIKNKISAGLSEKDQLYCSYIKEFFKYYNSIEGNCSPGGKGPIFCGVIGKYKSTLIDTGTLDIIYKKCNFDKVQCEGDSSVKKDFPCLEIKDNLFKNQSQSGNIRNIASTLNTAILPFISISGISLIFYKFTPLGSYLRTRLRRKKNINTNTHEEKYNNLENISEIQGNYTDNINYNIMYK